MDMVRTIVTPANVMFMLQAAGRSLIIATFALIFGNMLGIIGASGRISKNKAAYTAATLYVELIRGTPMLLQIYFLFLGLPAISRAITGVPLNLNVMLLGIIAMSINSGAYSTELFRAGIQSIDRGQWEASKSLGLNYISTMRFVILPQAVKRIIPPMVSEYVTLIKDSSLIGVVGAIELLQSTRIIGTRHYNFIVPLLMASVMYLVMTLTISKFAKKLERKLAVSD